MKLQLEFMPVPISLTSGPSGPVRKELFKSLNWPSNYGGWVGDPNDRRKPGDHDYGKPGGYDNGAGHWNTLEKRCSNDDSKKCDSYINCPLGTPGDYGECEGAWFEHTDFDMDGFVTQSWLATSVGAMNRRRAVSFPQRNRLGGLALSKTTEYAPRVSKLRWPIVIDAAEY